MKIRTSFVSNSSSSSYIVHIPLNVNIKVEKYLKNYNNEYNYGDEWPIIKGEFVKYIHSLIKRISEGEEFYEEDDFDYSDSYWLLTEIFGGEGLVIMVDDASSGHGFIRNIDRNIVDRMKKIEEQYEDKK